jgi:excisionase family DNA binding protein
MPTNDALLTPLEVAQQLGVSDQTIYNWIKEKRLAALKMGRLLRVHQSEVDRFIAANSSTPQSDEETTLWEDPDAQEFQPPGRTTWR